ncbi:long-chain fatty acid--CoA ligase [Nocardia speluncae]|uniref:Long-chain fatty acid--CoA ligase n=1 Tax=Nocardia speluncae TaxID=419477 RepID=A0A846X976_9NOCA|nr:long-chain fatty acid--CoA ligase [Nocardia speluncae]NKY32781.1 long-chain fatty acid--CoA ligase [Nocardia speluncae]
MLNQGIGSWPYRRARVAPTKTAMIFRDRELTYAELDRRVTALANALRARKVEAGDRVALIGGNHPAYLETLYATGLLGAVFVPLNARLTAPEVEYALIDSGASVLIHTSDLAEVVVPAAAVAQVPTRIVVDGGPDDPELSYEALLVEGAAHERPDVPVTLDDPCFLMYTSGTTGRPKGVVTTHGNVIFTAMNAVIDLDLRTADVSVVCSPMFHTAALNMVANPTMLKGGTVVIEPKFEAGRLLEVIERHRVTFMFAVPTMCDLMSTHPDWPHRDLSSLRFVNVAAAPVPPRTLRTFSERGIPMCQGYGLTETGPGALVLHAHEVERKLGSAGVPHFFTDVRLVTADGHPAGPGQAGEIQISGPNVTSEYWQRPEATADAFADGRWFRSGDIGVADDEGFVRIVDRLKDMIISGGENIYPAEVEAALLEMPGVRECAVFGAPDDKWGEIGVAAIVQDDGFEGTDADIAAFLGERLARYKIPKRYICLPEIPRNATGKILKHELRRQFVD